jgi:hypothetical protein
MRMNLMTSPATDSPRSNNGKAPLSLTLRPACGLPGEYKLSIGSGELIRILRKETSLPSTVLERFESGFQSLSNAKLLGVDLSDKVLTEIWYFID